jgi:hypothetical protein
VSEPSIRLVLDTSAIIAYARESMAVGEVIADEAGLAVGLPVLCLIEAKRSVTDTPLLGVLVGHPAAVVLNLDTTTWGTLSSAYDDTVGRVDAASAAMTALGESCNLLTAQPRLYAGLPGGGDMVIEV